MKSNAQKTVGQSASGVTSVPIPANIQQQVTAILTNRGLVVNGRIVPVTPAGSPSAPAPLPPPDR